MIKKAAILLSVLAVFILCPKTSAKDTNALFQVSTINALMSGIYDGNTTVKELLAHGDTGMGTFNGLDGEMVVLDGKAFRVGYDGKVSLPLPDQKVPFAMNVFFNADEKAVADKPVTYQQLKDYIKGLFPTGNLFYAIRVDGRFSSVEVRSVPKQKRPYVPLAEALKKQSVFNFKDISGTMIGFWCPGYASGMNNPGYHFHFLSYDRTSGGHVLDAFIEKGSIKVDRLSGLYMILPDDSEFYKADLTGPAETKTEK